MPLKRKTAIVGTAILAQQEGDPRSLEELLYDVVQAALKDAGMVIDDIDGIVVGSNDQYDGRAIAIMMASGSVGGVDRDILSTPSAGEHALVMSTLRVASDCSRRTWSYRGARQKHRLCQRSNVLVLIHISTVVFRWTKTQEPRCKPSR